MLKPAKYADKALRERGGGVRGAWSGRKIGENGASLQVGDN